MKNLALLFAAVLALPFLSQTAEAGRHSHHPRVIAYRSCHSPYRHHSYSYRSGFYRYSVGRPIVHAALSSSYYRYGYRPYYYPSSYGYYRPGYCGPSISFGIGF